MFFGCVVLFSRLYKRLCYFWCVLDFSMRICLTMGLGLVCGFLFCRTKNDLRAVNDSGFAPSFLDQTGFWSPSDSFCLGQMLSLGLQIPDLIGFFFRIWEGLGDGLGDLFGRSWRPFWRALDPEKTMFRRPTQATPQTLPFQDSWSLFKQCSLFLGPPQKRQPSTSIPCLSDYITYNSLAQDSKGLLNA